MARTRKAGIPRLIALVLAGWVPVASAQAPAPRQVAAPPADILSGVVRLPDPIEGAVSSRAAMLAVDFTWDGARGWSFQGRLPVESAGPLSIALLAPDAARWSLTVDPGSGGLAPLGERPELGRVERRTQVLAQDLPGWVVDRYDLERALEGEWSVRVQVPDAGPDRRPSGGWIVAAGESALRVEAWAGTALLLADERIGVLARLSGGEEPVSIERGEVWLDVAGHAVALTLADDGEHADGAADDGLFGAWLPPWTSGEVRARVELAGRVARGGPFLRTTQLGFPVLERRVALTGAAWSRVEDHERLRIDLEAWPLGPAAKLQLSAEVWGRDEAGRAVPVCWLSRMDEPQPRGETWTLPLWLDGRWLDCTGARRPLELRYVRVQDPVTHVPFDLLERVQLEVDALPAVVGRGQRTVTREMLMGPLQASLAGATPAGPLGAVAHVPYAPALMLVHGYCSSGNIWPPADFTQPKLEFLDPNANRTHDQFAQLIDQRAKAAGIASFGVVGHSQGGAAALHLYTYYHSGLDRALGPRLIQSVATPYQGTPLASLGSFACGTNNDMTPSGAATWLAGIPSWARAQVFYWTTSDAGSACNFLTSLMLSDPEDGTIEKARGQLPGANSMGHVTGWCHTTGMSYPASYTDHARNQEMNAQAAR